MPRRWCHARAAAARAAQARDVPRRACLTARRSCTSSSSRKMRGWCFFTSSQLKIVARADWTLQATSVIRCCSAAARAPSGGLGSQPQHLTAVQEPIMRAINSLLCECHSKPSAAPGCNRDRGGSPSTSTTLPSQDSAAHGCMPYAVSARAVHKRDLTELVGRAARCARDACRSRPRCFTWASRSPPSRMATSRPHFIRAMAACCVW